MLESSLESSWRSLKRRRRGQARVRFGLWINWAGLCVHLSRRKLRHTTLWRVERERAGDRPAGRAVDVLMPAGRMNRGQSNEKRFESALSRRCRPLLLSPFSIFLSLTHTHTFDPSLCLCLSRIDKRFRSSPLYILFVLYNCALPLYRVTREPDGIMRCSSAGKYCDFWPIADLIAPENHALSASVLWVPLYWLFGLQELPTQLRCSWDRWSQSE